MRETRWHLFWIPLILLCIFLSGCTENRVVEKGTVQLTSSPSGAEIYFDSQYRGSTPSTIPDVEPGLHTIEMRYPGYTSWYAGITLPSGTSQIDATLTKIAVDAQGTTVPGQQQARQASDVPKVTVQISKNPMMVGDSLTISGTCTGSDSVIVMLYGTGIYAKGQLLDQPRVSSAGIWSVTWNPGTKVQSGQYTVIVSDPKNLVSDRAVFNVIGGGEVTVVPNTFAAAQGDTIRFTGRCSSGAQNVRLVLNGPEKYTGGVELATVSVLADMTYTFTYKLDPTMPTGVYTIFAYDVPKTTSGTAQFTVGYSSSYSS